MIDVVCADVMEWANSYEGAPFHAMLTDSPYEMSFMNSRWDGTGISFQPSTWAALAEHLLPGAWGMSFASSRGWHRLAVAIEDSGLRIHPSIFLWAQGSGFCKATNIHAQLEKRLCYQDENKDWFYKDDDEPMSTAPPFRHPRADRFYGHRYGGQVLAPKVEPIIVFQKPYEGKPVDCIVESGAGSLWVDGGRIGTSESLMGGQYCGTERQAGSCYGKHKNLSPRDYRQPTGRWPSNFVLSHVAPDADGNGGCERVGTKQVKGTCKPYERNIKADSDKYGAGCGDKVAGYQVTGHADADGLETVEEFSCVPACPIRRIGEESGETGSSLHRDYHNQDGGGGKIYGKLGQKTVTTHNDKGTAARFYFNADWSYEVAERLAGADPVKYQAKSSRRERDAGLSEMQEAMGAYEFRYRESGKGQFNGPTNVMRRNPHPTVKPIALTKWLATLLLPPPEYAPRRILVPFAGVMSEAIGCLLAGWEEVVAIEMDESYCEIGRARLQFWQGWSERSGETDPKAILKLAKKTVKQSPQNNDRQLALFKGGETHE